MSIPSQLEAMQGTMTVAELSRLMDVAPKTVCKWIRKHGLPAVRIGSSLWLDPSAVREWWLSHSVTMMPRKRN